MDEITEAQAPEPGQPTEEDVAQAYDMIPKEGLYADNPRLYKRVVMRQAIMLAESRIPKPVKTPEEIAREELEARILHDLKASSRLMGPRSFYRDVALEHPANIKTQVLGFLLETAPRYPDKNKTILLLGRNGSGKTFGAVGYIAQFSDLMEFSSYAISGFKLAVNFQTAVTKREVSLQYLENVKNLLIDDLPTAQDATLTKDFIAYLEALVKGRHERGLRTLITSNATTQEFMQCYGDRVRSVVFNQGMIFETTDPDYREARNRDMA
jgi:DNA replication protein DnaC